MIMTGRKALCVENIYFALVEGVMICVRDDRDECLSGRKYSGSTYEMMQRSDNGDDNEVWKEEKGSNRTEETPKPRSQTCS